MKAYPALHGAKPSPPPAVTANTTQHNNQTLSCSNPADSLAWQRKVSKLQGTASTECWNDARFKSCSRYNQAWRQMNTIDWTEGQGRKLWNESTPSNNIRHPLPTNILDKKIKNGARLAMFLKGVQNNCSLGSFIPSACLCNCDHFKAFLAIPRWITRAEI